VAVRVQILACILLPLCCASQEDLVKEKLSQAKDLQQRRELEAAARELRAAHRGLAAVEDRKVRDAQAAEIVALFRKVDLRYTERSKAEIAAARALLAVARNYMNAGWHHTAFEILEAADRLDHETVAGDLEKARAAAARKEQDDLSFAGEIFSKGNRLYDERDWTFGPGSLSTPPLLHGENTQCLLATRPLTDHVRISFEMAIGECEGKAGFLVGFHSLDEPCLLFELRQESFGNEVYLFAMRGLEFEVLARRSYTPTPEERKEGVKVSLEIRRHQVRVQCGACTDLVAESSFDLSGTFGPFVSGDSPFTDPVTYKNLEVEPLGDKSPGDGG